MKAINRWLQFIYWYGVAIGQRNPYLAYYADIVEQMKIITANIQQEGYTPYQLDISLNLASPQHTAYPLIKLLSLRFDLSLWWSQYSEGTTFIKLDWKQSEFNIKGKVVKLSQIFQDSVVIDEAIRKAKHDGRTNII